MVNLGPVGGVISVAGCVLRSFKRPLRTFSLSGVANGRVGIRAIRGNAGFIALSNIRHALARGSLVVYGTRGPVYVTNMFKNLRSNIASGAASMFVRSTCFGPAAVHGDTHHFNLGASTDFHFRHNVSPGGAVCILGCATVLVGRVTNNRVDHSVISVYPRGVRGFGIRLGLSGMSSLVKGRVRRGVIRHVLRNLRVGIVGHGDHRCSLRIPTCHISMRHSISMVRSVLHVCNCGGIRFDSHLVSGLDCSATISDAH